MRARRRCPFCEARNPRPSNGYVGPGGKLRAFLLCRRCRARGPAVRIGKGEAETIRKAVRAWDERVDPDAGERRWRSRCELLVRALRDAIESSLPTTRDDQELTDAILEVLEEEP